MTTATNDSTILHFTGHGKTMLWRFVWKEFRMIRGLWAAVVIMGLLVQCAEKMLLPGSTDFALTLFYTALSAATLYAVGAAATTFSVEHEEETYDLLTRLPMPWWPPFAAKLLVTLASAILLAGTLSITAFVFRGPHFVREDDARTALGMMGFAIIEGVAWGTLFSLLIKRPLLAAIVTLVVCAITVNVIVSLSTYTTASPESYVHALPIRLAIIVAVFGCTLFVARRWLTVIYRPAIASRAGTSSRFARFLSSVFTRTRETGAIVQSGSRRRMLARLLWQTWRESWKLLLAPLGAAVLLFAGIAAAIGLSMGVTNVFNEVTTFVFSSALLFAPALYGAMVFHTDQRRHSYRFFAEHAARPRYIWLARHIVWLGALVAVGLVLFIAFAAFVWSREEFNSRKMFEYYLEWGIHPNASTMTYSFATGAEIVARLLYGFTFGALVAYGVGQLFSMAIRSEILAAFLALLVTLVVTAWVTVVCLWNLSAVLFLVPIFVGLMLATWLRAPDWIAGRNSWRGWWKPALALIAPLLLIAAMLTGSRLAQLRYRPPTSLDQMTAEAARQQDFVQRLAALRERDNTGAAQTADMYLRVAASLGVSNWPDDLFKPWRKPEYWDRPGVPTDSQIDEHKIPPDQLPAFKKAQQKQEELIDGAFATAVNEALKISRRLDCRFHFDPDYIGPPKPGVVYVQPFHLVEDRARDDINRLIQAVAGISTTKFDRPAQRFLAAIVIGKHVRNGQPSPIVIAQLNDEKSILQWISNWALGSERTKEELSEVLDTLTPTLQAPESPADALLADHAIILDVISGKRTPFILSTNPIQPHAYLAYLANQLGWERQRAVRALDQITRTNIRDTDNLTSTVSETKPQEIGVGIMRHWLRPDWGGLPALWEVVDPAAVTSYLTSLEYSARVPISGLNRAYCDNVTCRHATLLQIALALYRVEHKEYPARLMDLVPKYLEQLPLDPYSRQSFQYLPAGLDLPLQTFTPDHNSYGVKIEAKTPVLWSVGVGNVRLTQLESSWNSNDGPVAIDEELKPAKIHRFYRFINEEQPQWNSHNFVFSLSK